MRHTIIYLNLVLAILFLFSCRKEDHTAEYKPKFVVEGWIDDNDYPYVILTHNLPFFTGLDSAQLAEVVIRYAKVTVTDGEETEILTARRDDRYFPYFLYRGTSLKGKVGRSYKLTVEYAGNTLTAETSIPKPVGLDSLWFKEAGTGKLQMNIAFTDDVLEKNYYRIYTKLEKDKIFSATLLANQDDKYFNGKSRILQINRGRVNNLVTHYEPYFVPGDTAMFKIATIPKSGFDFWSGFQDEILNSSNPLIGNTRALESNIKGPGIGIWCGYGVRVYRAVAKK